MRGFLNRALCAGALIFASNPLQSSAQVLDQYSFGAAVLTAQNGEQLKIKAAGNFGPSTGVPTQNHRILFTEDDAGNTGAVEVPCDNPGRVGGHLDSNGGLQLLSVACSEEQPNGEWRTRLLSGPIMTNPTTGLPLLIPIQTEVLSLHANRINKLDILLQENEKGSLNVVIAMKISHSREDEDFALPYIDSQIHLLQTDHLSQEIRVQRYDIPSNLSTTWSLAASTSIERSVADYSLRGNTLYTAGCGDEARWSAYHTIGINCGIAPSDEIELSSIDLDSANLDTTALVTIDALGVISSTTTATLAGSDFSLPIFAVVTGWSGNLHVVTEPKTQSQRFVLDTFGLNFTTIPTSFDPTFSGLSFNIENNDIVELAKVGDPSGSYSFCDIEPNSCGDFVCARPSTGSRVEDYFFSYSPAPNAGIVPIATAPGTVPPFVNFILKVVHDEVGINFFTTDIYGGFLSLRQYVMDPELDNNGKVWSSQLSLPGGSAVAVGPSCQ